MAKKKILWHWGKIKAYSCKLAVEMLLSYIFEKSQNQTKQQTNKQNSNKQLVMLKVKKGEEVILSHQ